MDERMKRTPLEPKDYKKWLDAIDLVACCVAWVVMIAMLLVVIWHTRHYDYIAFIAVVLATAGQVLWIVTRFVLGGVCAWVFDTFFARMIWPTFSSEVYKGAGEAKHFIHLALRSGGGIRFLARRVAELDMQGVAREEKFAFLGGQIAQGGCCLICDSESNAEVLQRAGARHLEGALVELGKSADIHIQYLYEELLYKGAWEMLCGVGASFPRFPRACCFLSSPEEMDITRIVNQAKLFIASGPDDEYWWLCWENGETSKRDHQAFVLKWPPDEWCMEHSTQEHGVFSFITKAVGADKVAAVHEISGKRKDWRMHGLASRDWAHLSRRAENSGRVFFSLRVDVQQVLQAWHEMGYAESAESRQDFSDTPGFAAMLDIITPEGGCVVSPSHDAEFIYIWV